MDHGHTLQGLKLTVTMLFAGLLGSCVGFLWSLAVPLPAHALAAAPSWALGWMALGGIQGACMAPAHGLARGAAPRSLCRFLLAAGGLTTTLVGLALWHAVGRTGPLSLGLALGLIVLCAMPLCAYLVGRHEQAPALPVWL
ncbi:MAG: hypothetical protein RMK29_06085 [Myxococcales bacterium]|nr:hypothetical protein [Myxococcota bacterium]MDW8281260.1 hypothetical protein [Myxococcales bacterium]